MVNIPSMYILYTSIYLLIGSSYPRLVFWHRRQDNSPFTGPLCKDIYNCFKNLFLFVEKINIRFLEINVK